MVLMFRRTKLCIAQELIKEQLVNMFGHFKRDNVTRYFASSFFHESSSPKPLKITLGSFKFFLKICGNILKTRCTTGITTPAANLPPVSPTPMKNLPPVSATLSLNCHQYYWCWSTILLANNGNNIRLLQFKVNLKKNIFILTLLPMGVQTKYIKL